MKEYHKIETLFNRAVDGSKKLIVNSWRNETVEFLKNNRWHFTEKIDGTNIRVNWDGRKVTFGGRTDRANIPAKLVAFLNDTFGSNEAEQIFEQKFGETEVTLYGEGYGAGIQSGGNYRPDVCFILFDVLIGDIWLTRESVEDIAEAFGIDVVPFLGVGTLDDAIRIVMDKPTSKIGTAPMEGIVARPAVEVRDRLGRRVIVKIKVKDFAGLCVAVDRLNRRVGDDLMERMEDDGR